MRSTRRRRLASLLALVLGVATVALAERPPERPPEALESEQRAQAIELSYLIRKTDSLSSQLVERRGHLRKRLRAMYKMSQGGYLRLLLGADSAGDLFARRDAANRILHRDVSELEAVRAELTELQGLRERLREGERRAAELAVAARETVPSGLSRKDAITPPAGGAIERGFGPYRDAESGLEFTSDGVTLGSRPGEAVHAPAAGAVRSVGEVPGLGLAIILDHGDGWMTLVGHLAEPRVKIGARVPRGFEIAEAAGPAIEFQLSQGGAWIDPAPWIAR